MAKTRSEEFFTKGLKWGAILGGVLFAAAALISPPVLAAGVGYALFMAIIDGIFGAALFGAFGGVVGGITGLFFKKDEKCKDNNPSSPPQKMGRSAERSGQGHERAQDQGQGQRASPTYYQDQVTTSRTDTTVQRSPS